MLLNLTAQNLCFETSNKLNQQLSLSLARRLFSGGAFVKIKTQNKTI